MISKMKNYKNLTNFQKEKLEQLQSGSEIARREQDAADRARAAYAGVYAIGARDRW
jgi:hypothetical protein